MEQEYFLSAALNMKSFSHCVNGFTGLLRRSMRAKVRKKVEEVM